jgi:hypothetical protein
VDHFTSTNRKAALRTNCLLNGVVHETCIMCTILYLQSLWFVFCGLDVWILGAVHLFTDSGGFASF